MNNIWTLAQAGTNQEISSISSEPLSEHHSQTTTLASEPNQTTPAVRQPGPLGGSSLIFIGLMFLLMYFVLFRGPRKKQQQHKQMVQSLQKNDRVRTIGGIIGTVVDIKDDEITLKVDESNNTKIKVTPGAIGKNISKDKS